MSAALDWLKQQRRPAVAPLPPPSTAPKPTPRTDDWQDVFDTLRRLRERGPRKIATMASTGGAPVDRALHGEEIAPGLWRREQRRPWPIAPTSIELGELATPSPAAHRRGTVPLPETVEASRLAFFDTETTGLAGGTGTRAFMVGLARFTPEGLAITQFTTATMAAEAPMLRAVLEALGDNAVLVSYNGKSYDRPLLGTRLRLSRIADPLSRFPHLDLLHPTRRRLRHALPDCRLATVERRWLGIVRDDDLPGSEAPAAWLGSLRGGSSALLRRVGEHTAQDLASLAALLLKHLEPDEPRG
ncbi:MAG: ribonuclease H-like domain-containing protein [Silanimonas sp.]